MIPVRDWPALAWWAFGQLAVRPVWVRVRFWRLTRRGRSVA